MAVDSDTQKYLEDVKKGKPRRFVMICKGVNILSLIVYKKGSLEKYKKQAKQEGKGLFYHGVIDGKGANISFKLLGSDGFDKPPGKELILKDFLKMEAGMTFKPVYEIVDQLPTVSEDEDEGSADPTSPPEPGPEHETTANSQVPGSSPSPAAKLAAALKQLKPLMDQAIDNDPEQQPGLHATMVQIAGEIKSQQFDQAKRSLVEFAARLKSLATPSAEPAVDPSHEFDARRELLEPRLLMAQQADRDKAAKLATVWDYAHQQSAAGNFTNAVNALDKLQVAVDALLAKARPGQANAPGTGSTMSGFRDRWNSATARWRDASEEVDVQIEKLQHALKQTDDDELHEIAEFGLNGITGGTKVKLMTAIQEINNAGAEVPPPVLGKTRQAVAAFLNHINHDRRVEVCDANPFGVTLTIRETLGPALAGLEAALESAEVNV